MGFWNPGNRCKDNSPANTKNALCSTIPRTPSGVLPHSHASIASAAIPATPMGRTKPDTIAPAYAAPRAMTVNGHIFRNQDRAAPKNIGTISTNIDPSSHDRPCRWRPTSPREPVTRLQLRRHIHSDGDRYRRNDGYVWFSD